MRAERNPNHRRQALRGTLGVALVLGMLLSAGCGDGGTGTPSTTSATNSDTPTTSTALPVTPSTTVAVSSTSTTVPPIAEPAVIHLAGYTTVFSQDGVVRVNGWLDRPAEVMVGDVTADVLDDQYDGISTFETVLNLEPGSHATNITATDSQGAESTIVLSVLVDPALEMQLAQLQGVDLVARTVVADDVEFLTGDEATNAGREDGVIGENEEMPGGFYLRNRNPELRTLTLGDPGVVILQACFPEQGPCVVEQAVGIDAWVDLLAGPEVAEQRFGWNWYGNSDSPYWLTLQDGRIVQIREQYLP